MNSITNNFISSKKLQLNPDKCSQIHIGKKSTKCPDLKVQNKPMKKADQEKYLGDIIHKSGKPHATIVERIAKGYGIASNIIAIITDIPLGKRRVQIGLELRQAWFINGILFNSEVWPKINKSDIEDLEKIDHLILRKILGAHSKSPVEMLYLETSSLPIPYIISSRRAIYLQTILKRSDQELTKKVYVAMKNDPNKGDWSELVWQDMQSMQINIQEKDITNMNETEYKKFIKSKIRSWAFKDLRLIQMRHMKVRDITFQNLEKAQEYLSCSEFTNSDVSLLYNLRCQTVKNIKDNFHNMYQGQDLKCDLCETENDTQMHILRCTSLMTSRNTTVKYDHIFGSLQEQKAVIVLYSALMEEREGLLEEGTSLPGLNNSGPMGIN